MLADIKEKQIEKMNVNEIKQTYSGKRVRLLRMNDTRPIRPGTRGTVVIVDDIGQIHVAWDNGFMRAIIQDEDEFEIINDKLE